MTYRMELYVLVFTNVADNRSLFETMYAIYVYGRHENFFWQRNPYRLDFQSGRIYGEHEEFSWQERASDLNRIKTGWG